MSQALLFSLLKSRHIRDVDHALAMSLQRLDPETPELVAVAVALASKAHSLGHSCLPLDRLDDLLIEASAGPAPPWTWCSSTPERRRSDRGVQASRSAPAAGAAVVSAGGGVRLSVGKATPFHAGRPQRAG